MNPLPFSSGHILRAIINEYRFSGIQAAGIQQVTINCGIRFDQSALIGKYRVINIRKKISSDPSFPLEIFRL